MNQKLASFSPRPVSPEARSIAIALISFVLIGISIAVVKRGAFIFFYVSYYRAIGWAIFVCLLPLLAHLLLKQPRFTISFQTRYPTRWVRRFIMYPLTIALLAAMIVLAPFGWLAGVTWAFGQQSALIPAKVIWIEELKSRKGCDQEITLALLSSRATICLADHYNDSPLENNQEVFVAGKESSFGFLIQNIIKK